MFLFLQVSYFFISKIRCTGLPGEGQNLQLSGRKLQLLKELLCLVNGNDTLTARQAPTTNELARANIVQNPGFNQHLPAVSMPESIDSNQPKRLIKFKAATKTRINLQPPRDIMPNPVHVNQPVPSTEFCGDSEAKFSQRSLTIPIPPKIMPYDNFSGQLPICMVPSSTGVQTTHEMLPYDGFSGKLPICITSSQDIKSDEAISKTMMEDEDSGDEIVKNVLTMASDVLRSNPPYCNVIKHGDIRKDNMSLLIKRLGMTKNQIFINAYLKALGSNTRGIYVDPTTGENVLSQLPLNTLVSVFDNFWEEQRKFTDMSEMIRNAVCFFRVFVQTYNIPEDKCLFSIGPCFPYFILSTVSVKTPIKTISIIEKIVQLPIKSEQMELLNQIEAAMYFKFNNGYREYTTTFRNMMVALRDPVILKQHTERYRLRLNGISDAEDNIKYFEMGYKALTNDKTILTVLEIIGRIQVMAMTYNLSPSGAFETLLDIFDKIIYEIMEELIIPADGKANKTVMITKINNLQGFEKALRFFHQDWMEKAGNIRGTGWAEQVYKMHTHLNVFTRLCQKLSIILAAFGNLGIVNMDRIKFEEFFECIVHTAVDSSRSGFFLDFLGSTLYNEAVVSTD